MTILSIAADVLWILSLSIMASATRTAWMRMEPETRVPVQGAWRLSRNVALGVMFGAPLVLGLALSAMSRLAVHDAQSAVILFLMRTLLAGLFAVVCLTWLRGSLRTLEDEGVVTP